MQMEQLVLEEWHLQICIVATNLQFAKKNEIFEKYNKVTCSKTKYTYMLVCLMVSNFEKLYFSSFLFSLFFKLFDLQSLII